MMNISVIMCTYNGEKFIEEQLRSIDNQTLKPSEIIICDDNSNDCTIEIVKSFMKNYNGKIRLCENKKNIGIIKNFEKVLKLASCKYIAFCDQDDVWLPFKLKESVDLIMKLEKKYGEDTPLLIHTDLYVVNKKLEMVHKSFFKMQKIHNVQCDKAIKTLLVQNYITGCTMMINKSVKRLVLPFPENIIMHDWWIGLMVSAKGKIAFLDKQTILYRQHNNNSVGAVSWFSMQKIKSLLEINCKINSSIKQIESFCMFTKGYHIKEEVWIKKLVSDLEQGKIVCVLRYGVNKQGMIRKIIFFSALIIRWCKLKIINA